jgi:hypothetical protein
MVEKLSHEDFENRVGEKFTATTPDGNALHLTLTDVSVRGEAAEGHRTPFSIEFRDEAHEHVPQQTLAVEHGEMGQFDLFLVPLGPDPRGMRYEAVFG